MSELKRTLFSAGSLAARLQIAGTESFLPPAEARMLRLLLECRDTVLSRDALTSAA